jgi:outer membrane protein TolC
VLRRRNEELAAAGRRADIQVDPASQDELRSRDQLIREEQRYERLLDDFKRFLGPPLDVALECDEAELERLQQALEVTIDMSPQELARVALAGRLDYLTTVDRVEDAERAVHVAADDLRAGLDLAVTGNQLSEEGKPLDPNWDASFVSARLELDLPIDRLPERNAFRAAEVRLQVARRDAVEAADVIRADLRELLRQTVATRAAYDIQQNAVTLAERRVESARLRLDAGRADTRDILEAQEDLVAARNAATAALIELRLAQLALFRDVEVLRVDPGGFSVYREALARPLPPAHPPRDGGLPEPAESGEAPPAVRT